MSNRDENLNCDHVHMRPVRKPHYLIPFACHCCFYRALSSVGYSEAESTAESRTEMYLCNCIHFHPALDSSQSEDSQLSQRAG